MHEVPFFPSFNFLPLLASGKVSAVKRSFFPPPFSLHMARGEAPARPELQRGRGGYLLKEERGRERERDTICGSADIQKEEEKGRGGGKSISFPPPPFFFYFSNKEFSSFYDLFPFLLFASCLHTRVSAGRKERAGKSGNNRVFNCPIVYAGKWWSSRLKKLPFPASPFSPLSPA